MIRRLMLLLLIPLSAAAAESTNLIATGVVELSAAYPAWDGTGFAKAASTFAKAPESCTSQYWAGTAEFHRLLFLLGEPLTVANRQASAKALEAAEEYFRKALNLHPHDKLALAETEKHRK